MVQVFSRLVAGISVVIIVQMCAAQRGPSGGPVDLAGPTIVGIEPVSGAYAAEALKEITIYFDELVNPVSVPGSIVFTPAIEFATRIRGRRVEIRPLESLADNQVYVITLHRGVRDYNGNAMPDSRQFVYTTGRDIPLGVVKGELIVRQATAAVEVGLFRPDSSGEYRLYQSLPLSQENSFMFSYLPEGAYRVVALAGGWDDFPGALNKRDYALLNQFQVHVAEDTATVVLLMDAPLYEPQISSVAWVTPTYLELTFDVPFSAAGAGTNLQPTADKKVYGYQIQAGVIDTVRIDLGMAINKLGDQYTIQPFNLPVSVVIDTIAPLETSTGGIKMLPVATTSVGLVTEATIELHFSEPAIVREHTLGQLSGRDSTAIPLVQKSPFLASITVPNPDQYSKLEVPGDSIYDYVGNALGDSILVRKLTLPAAVSTGEIRGSLSSVTGRVAVEALAVATGQRVGIAITDSAEYHLAALVPGFYIIFAREVEGISDLLYYSGSWVPYKHAARFGYFPEHVEVRARWEVHGIDINLSADTKYPQN